MMANHLAVVLLLISLLSSCRSWESAKPYIFLTSPEVPREIWEKSPEVCNYGLYRKLNTGQFEFISICNVEYHGFLAIHKDDALQVLRWNSEGRKIEQEAIEYLKEIKE
jgi:hypothetical protein